MALRLSFTLSLLTCLAFNSHCQILFSYKPGIIVTNDHDTVSGFIKDRGSIRNSRTCIFKKDRQSKSQKFLPGHILAFRFTHDKYFESAEININDQVEKRFLEVLVKGSISLYSNKNKTYYIQKEESNITELVNEKIYLTIVPEENIQVSRMSYLKYAYDNYIYKDTLRSVLSDSKRIQNQINNARYTKKSLIGITSGYNKTTAGVNNYIKDLKPEQLQFGFYLGGFHNRLQFLSVYDQQSYMPFNSYLAGAFLGYPLTFIRENFIFQTELNSSWGKLQHQIPHIPYQSNLEASFFKIGIGLLLKYEMFPRHLISPSIAVGKNTNYGVTTVLTSTTYTDFKLYQFDLGGWFGEVGLTYRVSPESSLFINLRMNSLYNLTLKNNLYGQYILNPFNDKLNVGSVIIGVKF
jgi:hypothetical protein